MEPRFKKVLIIGINGGLAQITAKLIKKLNPTIKVLGVDNRPVNQIKPILGVDLKKIRYTRNEFERLFRDNKFDAIYHLGRMTHAKVTPKSSLAQRLDLNVMGTNRILEMAKEFNVKKVIVLSTWHVYGAFPDNPIFIKENSLLKASLKNPELRDVVEMDQIATNWMWKNQHETETLVFRPCSIVGPTIKNSMTKYLTTPYAPLGIDYNPMMQFIHEYDMAHVLAYALNFIPMGTYNVAPPDFISIQEAKKLIDVPYLPSSVIALEVMAKWINKNIFTVPTYLIDYLKYSSLISTEEINKHLPKDFFRFSIQDSLQLMQMP